MTTQATAIPGDVDLGLRYRWGFDAFRTRRRYGLGIEVHVAGRLLIGLRLGSVWLSFGKQLVYETTSAATERR